MSDSEAVIRSPRVGGVELTVFFTGFIAATYGFGVYMFATMMPDMTADLHLGYGDAGTIIAVAQVGFLIAALSSGLLAHRIGSMRLVFLSVLVCGACLLGVAFATAHWQLIVLMFFMGGAAASVWVPMVSITQAVLPAGHHGKALGLMSSGTAYGVFLNGFLVPFLVPSYGWRSVWLVTGLLTLVFFACAAFRLSQVTLDDRKSGIGSDPVTAVELGTLALLRRPISVMVLAMMFFSGIACMPTQNYLVSLLRDDLNYGMVEAGRAWGAIGFVGIFGGFLMGWVADHISVRRAMMLTFSLLILAILSFLSHLDLLLIYLGAAVFGLAFNAVFGLMPALVSLKFRGHSATTIFGFGNLALGLGSIVGNYLGGATKEAFGSFQTIYMVSLGCGFVLLGLTILMGAQRAER